MSPVIAFEPGGYAFQLGGFPYSQGVIALPGHVIERVRWRRPVPVQQGFAAIAALPSTTSMSLRAYLRTPHANMPDYRLSREELDDIVAYLLTVRR